MAGSEASKTLRTTLPIRDGDVANKEYVDTQNNLIIRLHSRGGTPLIVPPSSELPINEWFAEIHFEPNAVTGDFQIMIEVAQFKDARR